jgi:aspartyl-tRNA(Asn)/glutamyl-tRNA(Gln) amidotransferase subunit C
VRLPRPRGTHGKAKTRSGYTLSFKHCAYAAANRSAWEEQTMSAKVTVEEVERVAELAHLELAPEETPRMVVDLNAILEYVAELNQLDTKGIAPLAQISELEGAGGASSLRQDVILPSLDRAAVMSQAPESNAVFFKVPKVIER